MNKIEIVLQTSTVVLYVLIAVIILFRARKFPNKREPLYVLALSVLLGLQAIAIKGIQFQFISTFIIIYCLNSVLSMSIPSPRKKLYDVALGTAFTTIVVIIVLKNPDNLSFGLFIALNLTVFLIPPMTKLFRLFQNLKKIIIVIIFFTITLNSFLFALGLLVSSLGPLTSLLSHILELLLAGFLCYLLVEENYLVRSSLRGLSESLFQEKNKAQKVYAQLASTRQSMINQERLISIGILAGGLVHDFKNILSLISVCAQLGIASGNQAKKHDCLVQITENIKYSMGSVISVLDQIRSQKKNEPIRLNLQEFLSHFIKVLKANYRTSDVSISLQIERNGIVLARKTDLEQILLNLVRNAVSAFQNRTISLAKEIHIRLCLNDNLPLIEVSDNAGGIQEETALGLFELQADSSQSTGVGLYLTRLLADINGLSIQYTHQPGGSIFTINFPETALAEC